jgi:hypothetical protein
LNLKDEITIELNKKLMPAFTLFKNNFSEQTMKKLLFSLEEVTLCPEELIFEEGV